MGTGPLELKAQSTGDILVGPPEAALQPERKGGKMKLQYKKNNNNNTESVGSAHQ